MHRLLKSTAAAVAAIAVAVGLAAPAALAQAPEKTKLTIGVGGKPLFYIMAAGAVGDASRAAMRAADFPFFDRVSDALAVIRALDSAAVGRVVPAAPERPYGMAPLPALPALPALP